MPEISYVCSGCEKPIYRHEPVKLYSQPGVLRFFHNNNQCWPSWRIADLEKEIASLRRVMGHDDHHEDGKYHERLHNGG